jgi:hypothetical protein
MLVKVKVENFKSFDKEAELNMIASSKIRKHIDHKVSVKKVNLLKSAVIYGANASGKSNIIEVLKFFKFCVKNRIPVVAKRFYCRNKNENKLKESIFEVQILKNGVFYAYGFSAILDQNKIVEEWAYELSQSGDAKLLFDRKIGESPKLGDYVKVNSNDKKKFEIYAEDISGNENILFLTEMNRNKNISKDSGLYFFKNLFEWFNQDLVIYSPNTPITNFEYYYDIDSLKKVNKLIESFDTGISKVEIKTISIEDLKGKLPQDIVEKLIDDIKNTRAENKEDNIKISLRSGSDFYNIHMNKDNEIKITTLTFKHKNSFSTFDFDEESDGTRRLFDLMDIILKTDNEDTVYVIDELERSLHPKLTSQFIEVFNKVNKNRNIQLIFTTHESTIMDQNLFRRDEIWFIERDIDNSSRIYPLNKFQERYDKKLSKAYLEGRYGANPIFKKIDFEEVND